LRGIATVDTTGLVTGVGVGQATITAAAGSLSKGTSVEVLSGTTLALGTTRWSVDPLPNLSSGPSIGVVPSDSTTVVTIDVSETPQSGAGQAFVRGFDLTGRQTQMAALPLGPGESVWSVMGDTFGGVVVTVSAFPWQEYSLVRLALSTTTGGSWRYSAVRGHPWEKRVAQSYDGTIFVISGWAVVGIDGATGTRKFEVSPPASHMQIFAPNCPKYAKDYFHESGVGPAITVDATGSANVLVRQTDRVKTFPGDCWSYVNSDVADAEVMLYRISPSGALSVVPLHSYTDEVSLSFTGPELKPLPDEQDGVLAVWQWCRGGSTPDCQTRARHVTGTTPGTEYGLPYESVRSPRFQPLAASPTTGGRTS
jgi:hypothetical protein